MLMGLQAGFGNFLGAELQDMKAQGFQMARLDCQRGYADILAQEVLEAGLVPLVIIRDPDQMWRISVDALIELGNEPDLAHEGWTVESYRQAAWKCVNIAATTKHRLWLCPVSNLNRRGFDFLSRMPWCEWPEAVGSVVHRYPDGSFEKSRMWSFSFTYPFKQYWTRDDEIEELKRIVGDRPLGLSETGYDERNWTQEEVASNMARERALFARHGFAYAVGYQIHDSPPGPGDKYGFRAYDGENWAGPWKPVADAWTR